MHCDLLVIGSGFGGAVIARRAAAAGMRVIVLERGRRMDAGAWGDAAAGRIPLVQWTFGRRMRRECAPVEIRTMPGLTAVIGAALGGGSHHYTSVTVPARDEAFADGWPDGWSAASMLPYYTKVLERMRPMPVPRAFPQTAALERAAKTLDTTSMRLPMAIAWDDRSAAAAHRFTGWRHELAMWMRSPVGQKNTLDDAYLFPAERDGAELRTQHTVMRVGAIRGGYRVEYVRHDLETPRRSSLDAPRLVLSAGTINTVRLLLEARDVHRSLPFIFAALGHRFSGNGDCGALLVGPKFAFDNGPAPAASAWLDHWDSDRMFLMELGWLPVFRDFLTHRLRPLLRLRDRGRRDAAPLAWIIGGYGLGATGRLRLRHDGVLMHMPTPGDGMFDKKMILRIDELARAAGATLLRLPLALTRRHALTVHPLGGCTLADSPEKGVCDPGGQVFGHKNLYVADGSVLPAPLGVPPSLTIAAAAERIAESIVD